VSDFPNPAAMSAWMADVERQLRNLATGNRLNKASVKVAPGVEVPMQEIALAPEVARDAQDAADAAGLTTAAAQELADAAAARAATAVDAAAAAVAAAEAAETEAAAGDPVREDVAAAQQAADDAAAQASAALAAAQQAAATGGDVQQHADLAASAADAAREAAALAGTTVAFADADAAGAAADAAQAVADATVAQGLATSKVRTFRQDTAPTGAVDVGALWIDTANQERQSRWDGERWILVRDLGIEAAQAAADRAIADAADAQATADGKTTSYFQATAPTGLGAGDVGDLWFDTDDGNRMYRWSGSAWLLAADQRIAEAVTAAAAASTAAGNAQSTANSKIVTYYQATAPVSTGQIEGNLWVDTDDGLRLYRWTSGAWTSVRDTTIATAQSRADASYTLANGRNRVFPQATAPTAAGSSLIAGDLWIDTANGRRLSTWSGSAWVLQQFGTEVFAAKSINAQNLFVDGSIYAAALNAAAINGKTITGATIRTAASGQRIQIDSTNGLVGYNSAGVAMTSINPATGLLTATGANIVGVIQTAATGPRIRIAQTLSNGSLATGVIEFLGEEGAAAPSLTGSTSLASSLLSLSNGAGAAINITWADADAGGKENVVEIRATRLLLPSQTLVQSPLTPVTVNGGWGIPAGHKPMVYRTAHGTARLVGWFFNGGAYAANATQFPITMPAGWWPAQTQVFELPVGAGNIRALCTLLTDGRFRIDTTQGAVVPAVASHYLDNVEFHLAYTGA